jgi:glutathione synthase/RimK-type ligase-like ATP-grasp enzyme
MEKTLIIIGDTMMARNRFEPSLNSLLGFGHLLQKRYKKSIFITYDDVTGERLPDIRTAGLDVLLFFPYNYWNSRIERYDKDDRIYGDTNFGRDFNTYLMAADRIITRRYKNNNLRFINPPKACIIDRDKLRTYNILRRAGIRSPRIFRVNSVGAFNALLEKHGPVYIKPRFGAMGKGITYADRSGIYTNFRFRNKRISNRLHDYNWRPVKVPRENRPAFIGTLIQKGFIFQGAVNPMIYGNRKFDIRVYTVCRKTPYLYAKSVPVGSFITNWSQGGRIENRLFLNKALSAEEIRAIKTVSLKTAEAINLSFAGVDIIVDRDTRGINVLEIQSFPGYEKGFNLMRFLAVNI